MIDQMQYEFTGMDPSEWTENFLEDELTALLAMAPRNAHMKLKVDRHHAMMEGKLIIYSKAGAFIVEDTSDDITVLTKSLKRKMKSKLHKWKESHYDHGRAG